MRTYKTFSDPVDAAFVIAGRLLALLGFATMLLIAISVVRVTAAHAMQGWTTCHAAGTTVTSISGRDTNTAKMISIMTLPDAIEACQRNEDLKGAALRKCADKAMRGGDYSTGPVVTVWANCETGTLTAESTHMSAIHFKFPIAGSCAGYGEAAIEAFKTLCPSYKGKIEEDQ
jgi:hypothetical protein